MARRRGRVRRLSAAYSIMLFALGIVAVCLALSLFDLVGPPPSREGPITVLVLNGCGVDGVGLKTTRFLRARGYDVLEFKNADSFDYAETIVVDRTGDLVSAAALGRLLGTANVIQQVPATPLVDVVVVVGKDYGGFLAE